MDDAQLRNKIDRIIEAAGKLLPSYLADPVDKRISEGNVAMCIIDGEGRVFGTMWGDDKGRMRNSYQTAWRKASQVWITAIATGRYEELVYTNKVDWLKHGIMKPDLIGWEGGFPALLDDGSPLAVAVSGMRGEKDSELVAKTVKSVGGSV